MYNKLTSPSSLLASSSSSPSSSADSASDSASDSVSDSSSEWTDSPSPSSYIKFKYHNEEK